MSSRKRPSETVIVASGSSLAENVKPKPRLKVRVKRFHGVARWSWNTGGEDDVCGICQTAYEGCAPGVKYPGDECPVVYGKCGHAFHLVCVATWLNSSRQTCPMCRCVIVHQKYHAYLILVLCTLLMLILISFLKIFHRYSADWEYGASSDQRRSGDAN